MLRTKASSTSRRTASACDVRKTPQKMSDLEIASHGTDQRASETATIELVRTTPLSLCLKMVTTQRTGFLEIDYGASGECQGNYASTELACSETLSGDCVCAPSVPCDYALYRDCDFFISDGSSYKEEAVVVDECLGQVNILDPYIPVRVECMPAADVDAWDDLSTARMQRPISATHAR